MQLQTWKQEKYLLVQNSVKMCVAEQEFEHFCDSQWTISVTFTNFVSIT